MSDQKELPEYRSTPTQPPTWEETSSVSEYEALLREVGENEGRLGFVGKLVENWNQLCEKYPCVFINPKEKKQ